MKYGHNLVIWKICLVLYWKMFEIYIFVIIKLLHMKGFSDMMFTNFKTISFKIQNQVKLIICPSSGRCWNYIWTYINKHAFCFHYNIVNEKFHYDQCLNRRTPTCGEFHEIVNTKVLNEYIFYTVSNILSYTVFLNSIVQMILK